MKPQPGPWFASEMRMDADLWAGLNGDHPLTIVRANWDGFTGDVVAAVWADDDHDELATANLVSAAPDMRDALQALVNECSGKPRPSVMLALLANADLALAKARGQ